VDSGSEESVESAESVDNIPVKKPTKSAPKAVPISSKLGRVTEPIKAAPKPRGRPRKAEVELQKIEPEVSKPAKRTESKKETVKAAKLVGPKKAAKSMPAEEEEVVIPGTPQKSQTSVNTDTRQNLQTSVNPGIRQNSQTSVNPGTLKNSHNSVNTEALQNLQTSVSPAKVWKPSAFIPRVVRKPSGTENILAGLSFNQDDSRKRIKLPDRTKTAKVTTTLGKERRNVDPGVYSTIMTSFNIPNLKK
jgi:hypothetical protein